MIAGEVMHLWGQGIYAHQNFGVAGLFKPRGGIKLEKLLVELVAFSRPGGKRRQRRYGEDKSGDWK